MNLLKNLALLAIEAMIFMAVGLTGLLIIGGVVLLGADIILGGF